MKTLQECPHETPVRVTRLDGAGEDMLRLREVGVYEGAEVVVMTGGDPVILNVFNTRFAISQHVAGRVFIQPA